jgi:aspartyl-tRNA(Asn)/glutamyl-tRNA(Gln) amidotransferase subunit B
VLFDPDSGETRAMRTKEDAHDYRYFPDPDLPPLAIAGDWIERVRAEMPELPQAMAARFTREHALPLADAAALTQSLATAQYFEAALAEALRLQAQPRAEGAAPLAKLVVNWMMGELSRRLNSEGGLAIADAPVKAPVLAKLVCRIADGTLSSSGAKQVFDALWVAGGVGGQGSSGMAVEANVATSPKAAEGPAADVDAIIEAQGLRQVSDAGALGPLIDAVVADNPRSVSEYRSGKEKAFNALVGQVMKATRGKANPEQVGKLLKDKLR